ncbi:MAG TPA: hypothetical protein VL361_03500 [Candidatus Limnocylindrales bacterium]|jgi:hypothetical protein|nr:hypothetical protein [Candidatus Limnocylindrales bacterium]
MKKRHLILAAVAVAVVIGLAVVLSTLRPPPVLTVRCSKVAVMGDSVGLTLEISNRTAMIYEAIPVRLERLEEEQWKACPDGIASFSTFGNLGANGRSTVFCLVKRLPGGTQLRLVMKTERAQKGLESLALRARLRLSGQVSGVSLNPFDRVLFFTEAAEVESNPFVAP